jgi:hypothetical protein
MLFSICVVENPILSSDTVVKWVMSHTNSERHTLQHIGKRAKKTRMSFLLIVIFITGDSRNFNAIVCIYLKILPPLPTIALYSVVTFADTTKRSQVAMCSSTTSTVPAVLGPVVRTV